MNDVHVQADNYNTGVYMHDYRFHVIGKTIVNIILIWIRYFFFYR